MSDRLQPDENRAAAEAELEHELRGVLRREDAPAGLTQRILSRAHEQRALPRREKAHMPRLRAAALGMSAVLIAAGAFVTAGMAHRHRIEARQAQEARARLFYALQMTSRELSWAEHKVNQDMAEPGAAPARPAHKPKSAEEL